MKKRTIPIPIYNGKLVIIITDNLQSIEEEYNLTSTEGCSAVAFATTNKSGGTIHVMAFKGVPTEDVVAHESLHITNDILASCHAKLDPHNDEPQAYLLSWVVRQYYKFKNKSK